MKLEVIARVVAIHGKEWRLNESENVWRRDGAGGVGLSPTIVTKIVGEARVSHVELSGEVLDELDVGVEADVQAIESVLLGCGLRVGISERQAIHGHVITTLHVHFVVLSECRAIEFLAPVRFVVVHWIPVVVRIVVEERNGSGCRGIVLSELGRSNQFADIVLILTAVHHLGIARSQFEATKDVDIDFGCHGMSALGVDNHNAVGTASTIERGGVLEHFHGFDVLRVDTCKDVVEESVVDGLSVELEVHHHSVEDDKRLRVEVEGVETMNEHGCTLALYARTIDGANVASELLLDIAVDGNA